MSTRPDSSAGRSKAGACVPSTWADALILVRELARMAVIAQMRRMCQLHMPLTCSTGMPAAMAYSAAICCAVSLRSDSSAGENSPKWPTTRPCTLGYVLSSVAMGP